MIEMEFTIWKLLNFKLNFLTMIEIFHELNGIQNMPPLFFQGAQTLLDIFLTFTKFHSFPFLYRVMAIVKYLCQKFDLNFQLFIEENPQLELDEVSQFNQLLIQTCYSTILQVFQDIQNSKKNSQMIEDESTNSSSRQSPVNQKDTDIQSSQMQKHKKIKKSFKKRKRLKSRNILTQVN